MGLRKVLNCWPEEAESPKPGCLVSPLKLPQSVPASPPQRGAWLSHLWAGWAPQAFPDHQAEEHSQPTPLSPGSGVLTATPLPPCLTASGAGPGGGQGCSPVLATAAWTPPGLARAHLNNGLLITSADPGASARGQGSTFPAPPPPASAPART